MTTRHDQKRAFAELWGIALRYRWRFILPAFAVCAAVLLGSLALPRKYRASAVFERRSDLVLMQMTRRGATHSFQDPRQSLTQEIAGRPAVDQLIADLTPRLAQAGLPHGEDDLRALHRDILQRLIVRWDIATPQRDRIRVEYVGSDPRVASMVVNGLVGSYITRTRAEMQSKLTESAAFFQDKVTHHRRAIEALENKLLSFEIEHGELLPDTPNNLQAQLASVHESLSNAMSQRDAAALRVHALRQAIKDAPATIPTITTARNPQLVALEKKLADLRQQLYQYTVTFKMTPAHPDVQATRVQIAEVRQRLEATDAEVVTQRQTRNNPQRANLQLQLTAALSEQRAYADQAEALKQQIRGMSAQNDRLFQVRSTHRQLSRDLGEQQRQMAFWEDNLRRIDMALAAESGNRGVQLDFLRPAVASPRPVSPDLAQVVAAALLLGVAAGAAGVFLAHREDETFVAGEDLAQQMNLPLFGSVSEVITRRHHRLRTLQRAVLYPTAGLAMASVLIGAAGALYLDLEHPQTLTRIKSKARSLVAAERPEPAPPVSLTFSLFADGRDQGVPGGDASDYEMLIAYSK